MIGLFLSACSGPADQPTAIVLELQGEGVADAVDRVDVVLDPRTGSFVDSSGDPLPEGPHGDGTVEDYLVSDPTLELVLRLDVANELPTVDLEKNLTDPVFFVLVNGWYSTEITAQSEPIGPLRFVDGEVQTIAVPVALLDEPRPLCDNALDDDGDGWVDGDDPDCENGDTEIGFGSTECNDGEDNDGDGAFDCEDPDCEGKPACVESICDDGEDNDQDDAVDCQDSDCEEDAVCVETICDDDEDNDGDFLWDCEDPDCYDDPWCFD